jgi:hypothetical protein
LAAKTLLHLGLLQSRRCPSRFGCSIDRSHTMQRRKKKELKQPLQQKAQCGFSTGFGSRILHFGLRQ